MMFGWMDSWGRNGLKAPEEDIARLDGQKKTVNTSISIPDQ